uniref:Apolipoprotein D n=1 Tax=Mola mola TaxID=94237 RepID=A0A3Q3W0H5_MOLML
MEGFEFSCRFQSRRFLPFVVPHPAAGRPDNQRCHQSNFLNALYFILTLSSSKFSLNSLCLVISPLSTTDSQSFHLGSCPRPSVQEDFNYMGTWYEIEKLPAVFERGKCIQAAYSLLANGTVHVHNAELLPNGKINSIEGVAEVKDSSQPAILEVSVPDSPYWVLSTDYQSYSLVYSCFDYFSLFHFDFAWILARTRALSEDVLGRLHEKLAAAGVNVNHLTVSSNQTGCDVMTRHRKKWEQGA